MRVDVLESGCWQCECASVAPDFFRMRVVDDDGTTVIPGPRAKTRRDPPRVALEVLAAWPLVRRFKLAIRFSKVFKLASDGRVRVADKVLHTRKGLNRCCRVYEERRRAADRLALCRIEKRP